jgi:gamma-glutamyltranspeptidase
MTSWTGPRTGRPPARGERGMVATSHQLATGAGVHALRRGGSAVDAAIAANAVLCVVYPHMAGLGGDGFWLVHDGSGVTALNASGPAAAAATIDWYRERGHDDEIPSRGGSAALTVPGAVDGWREAHERHGRLDWADLFDDAIHWARAGAPVGRSLTEWTADDVPDLQQDDEAARIFLPGGRAPRDGDRVVMEDLARSFELIAEHGARTGFYDGELADRLCQGAADAGSPLAAEDLARFRAEWVEPISVTYRGFTAWEFPPNTQGFAALQILKLIEGYDVAAWQDASFEYLHHMAEAVKLAFADRNEWLTDPEFVDIPLDRLLDDGYLASRRELIDVERAMVMEEVEPGISFEGSARRDPPGGDTCYFCAVDGDGLAVSVIQSIYHDFGAAIVPPGTGIILQNRGSFFSLDDGHPNRLEPGKRTFHTLIPAMLTRDGAPWLVYGTMGGEGQPQTHAAMVTRMVDHSYDVQQAIEAPRWLMGRTWGAESQDLWLEGRIDDQVARELSIRGQPVIMLPDWDDNCGHAQAIRVHAGSGLLEGGADPRGDGSADGW